MLAPTEEVITQVHRYRDILAEEKKLKGEKELLKQGFAKEIGNATGFKCDDFTLTYKQAQPSQKIDTQSLIRALEGAMDQDKIADLIEAHTKETPGTRRLALRFQEENNG